MMVERKITICNKLGLHARAAAKFVTAASSFSSDVQLRREGRQVNGKSIMGVMMLAAAKGTELSLVVDGDDEDQAVEELARLVDNRFDEQE